MLNSSVWLVAPNRTEQDQEDEVSQVTVPVGTHHVLLITDTLTATRGRYRPPNPVPL